MCHQPPGTDVCITFKSSLMRGCFIRVPKETGIEWVMRTLGNPTDCYDMFRMSRPMFEKLHNVLVESYGLHSTRRMSSTESLALFLWTVGALNQLGSKEIDLSDLW